MLLCIRPFQFIRKRMSVMISIFNPAEITLYTVP